MIFSENRFPLFGIMPWSFGGTGHVLVTIAERVQRAAPRRKVVALTESGIGLRRGCSMAIVYRPARAEDLERADALVVQSINDLTMRHGFGLKAKPRPPHFQLFSLQDDPDGLWVAEEGGDIHGFGFSWRCG